MPAPIEIRVHAHFPEALTPGPPLNLNPTNWKWVHCLTFPVDTLKRREFSLRLYKWIRYATGTVIGAHGTLTTQCDSLDPINYDDDLPSESLDLYYQTAPEEKQHMFPIDPDLDKSRIITSSGTSQCYNNFRDEVMERDGENCVCTGFGEDCCDAVYFLPHSKGDMYIKTFTEIRGRDPSGNDIVKTINDICNGLFLRSDIHCMLGRRVAFLMTPNFAMDTSDVDPNADDEGGGEKRYTIQLFDPHDSEILALLNARIQVPSSTSKWPPASLFEAVFANAVIHHFHAKNDNDEFLKVLKKWDGMFCPGESMTTEKATKKHHHDYHAEESAKHKEQKEDHNQHAEKHAWNRGDDWSGTVDVFDYLRILPCIAMGPEKTKKYLEECEEIAAAAKCKANEDRINAWRGGFTGGWAS